MSRDEKGQQPSRGLKTSERSREIPPFPQLEDVQQVSREPFGAEEGTSMVKAGGDASRVPIVSVSMRELRALLAAPVRTATCCVVDYNL